jgi:hypothetical protein
VYRHISRSEISETLTHLRELFRQNKPSSAREMRAHEKRELLTRNLLSNLNRTKQHPTLHTVLEVADSFSLTLDGAHRLFGYDLEKIREHDIVLNGGRTHIIESYPFERDLLIDLPSQLGSKDIFRWNSPLSDLVPKWQTDVPIRVLEEEGWQEPGIFYVHIGTEDSLGSSLPPGSVALVEQVEEEEQLRPNPRAIYLLQFGNGYRCSRCVVTRGKLILLVSARDYVGPQEFPYPEGVRIAGRIRAFSLSLPLLEFPALSSLPDSMVRAPLILPWEHLSMDRLFAAKHRRFQRTGEEQQRIGEALESVFTTRLNGRTERRYRHSTTSQPHVDALIQLTVMNAARYSDAIRSYRSVGTDRGRYSLQTLLNAHHPLDLSHSNRRTHVPLPRAVWEDRRREFVEWPSLLSMTLSQPKNLDDNIIRLSEGNSVKGLEPPLSSGSLLVLDRTPATPDLRFDSSKTGWHRPIYALRRGTDFLCGYLNREGDRFGLVTQATGSLLSFALGEQDLARLRLVLGVAVPVVS